MLALGANGRGRAGLLSALRPQDVFATSLYTGNGSGQTITNGLDLAGRGGLVWPKARASAFDHALYDTLRGPRAYLVSNTTDLERSFAGSGVTSFNANGFTLGTNNQGDNANGQSLVAWSFRRASKFFDIVTYTGDGTSGRVIPHALGIDPGLVILRRRDAGDNWRVRHRSAAGELYLNLTQAQDTSFPSIPATSATNFTVGTNSNASGGTYVAYLFAHDPDTTNGIVQCGSYTTDASGNATVNLGWQPQFLMVKCTNTTGDWLTVDAARGFNASNASFLRPNTSGAENSGAPAAGAGFTATGFSDISTFIGANNSAVFLAIRAPI